MSEFGEIPIHRGLGENTPAVSQEKGETHTESLKLPQNEAVIDLFNLYSFKDPNFKEEFANKPKTTEHLSKLLHSLFIEQIESTKIASIDTPRNGHVEIPVTTVDVAVFAQKLWEQAGNSPIGKKPVLSADEKKEIKHKRFFVLPGFVFETSGHQLTFTEEIMNQTMVYLPEQMRRIAEGEATDDIKLFILGSPTSWWGKSSPEFIKNIEENGYKAIGEVFAPYIKQTFPEDPEARKKTAVSIYGVSQGVNIMTETARALIENDVVKEVGQGGDLPTIQLLADNAVGYAKTNKLTSLPHKFRIAAGFAAESVSGLFNKERRLALKGAFEEKSFLPKLTAVLQEKGIQRVDAAQTELNNQARVAFLKQLISGQDPNTLNIRMKLRTGIYDPLQPRPEMKYEVKRDRAAGQPITVINNNNEDVQEYGVKMSHTTPYFRKNVIARWAKVANRIYAMLDAPHPEENSTSTR